MAGTTPTDDIAAVKPPASRTFRIWYVIIQTVSLTVFAVLCAISAKFKAVYQQLEMTRLPMPTEVCMAVAPFFRSIVGLILLAALWVALVNLALRGTFDRALRKLIVINVIGTVALMGFYVLVLYVPILQIQHVLESK